MPPQAAAQEPPLPFWVRALPTAILAALLVGVAVPQAVQGDVAIARSLGTGLVLGIGLSVFELGVTYLALKILGVGE